MKSSYPSYKQMKQELDYDTLYDLYINKKLSCNKISKMYPENFHKNTNHKRT